MTRQALILALLSSITASVALPSAAQAFPDDIGAMFPSATVRVDRPARAASSWLSSGGVGAQHIAGWLISATVYGLCLTTSIPELVEGDPLLTVVRLSRGETASTGNISRLPPWAAAIARSVGVVMVSFDDVSGASGSSSVRIALLPIGPASSAGLSISGCFF
jgi:hypothetical protein